MTYCPPGAAPAPDLPVVAGVSQSTDSVWLCDANGDPILVVRDSDGAGGQTITYYDSSGILVVAPAFPLVQCETIPADLMEVCGIPGLPCQLLFLEDANIASGSAGTISFTNTPGSIFQHVITYDLTLAQANFVEAWYTGALTSGFDPLRSVLLIPLDVPAWLTPGQIGFPICAWWFVNPPIRVGNSITFDLDLFQPQIDGCPDPLEVGDYINTLSTANTSPFFLNPGPWGPVGWTNGGEGPFAYEYSPGGLPGSERALRVFNCRTIDSEMSCTELYGLVRVTTIHNDLGDVVLVLVTDPLSGAPLSAAQYGALIECREAQARCQAGCDYDFLALSNVNGSTGTVSVNNYLFPGDSRFELRLDLTGSPALLALIQNWINGGIQPGDFLFVDSTWNAPSVSTGAAFVIGEWMLHGSTPDIFGNEVRFLLDLNVSAPCDLAQFVGFTFDVSVISAAWLYAVAQEARDNPGYWPGPRPLDFNGTATISRSPNTEIQVVKICDTQPIRIDQQPVSLQYDIRRIDGQFLDADSLDATSFTLVVEGGVVLAGRGSPGAGTVALPPGSYTWGIDAARGILANPADNAVAALQRGFDINATNGQAFVYWTWQVSP